MDETPLLKLLNARLAKVEAGLEHLINCIERVSMDVATLNTKVGNLVAGTESLISATEGLITANQNVSTQLAALVAKGSTDSATLQSMADALDAETAKATAEVAKAQAVLNPPAPTPVTPVAPAAVPN